MNVLKNIVSIYLLALIISAFSCSKSDQDLTEVGDENLPEAAKLIFPKNNTECNEGIIISQTETEVLFQWEEAKNASSYVLTITNLNDGTSREIKTIHNEFLIVILRGTPYSWSVKSIASKTTKTAESEVWRFYNAGLPEKSHPPFPAEALSPIPGESVNQGSLTLKWQVSDIDNDIASYDIYLDMVNPPILKTGTTNVKSIDVTVSSGQVYYWKVITIDEAGNTSNSQVFQFIVN